MEQSLWENLMETDVWLTDEGTTDREDALSHSFEGPCPYISECSVGEGCVKVTQADTACCELIL
jgi:hypothetical protein